MTTEQRKEHANFVNTLLENWDNIRTIKPTSAHYILSDLIDAAIKDIEAGNLEKESFIIDYIQWLNNEFLTRSNNE